MNRIWLWLLIGTAACTARRQTIHAPHAVASAEATGQDSAYLANVRTYMRFVDSMETTRDPSAFPVWVTSIADGIIRRNGEVVGGFGIYTQSNRKGDTVYRIQYHENVPINTTKTFYYRNNRLVAARIELAGTSGGWSPFYQREDYVAEGRVVARREEKTKGWKQHRELIPESLLEEGDRRLRETLNDAR